MQSPTLPGTKNRLPSDFASVANAVQAAVRWLLHAFLSVRHLSLTTHSASACCAQKSASVTGLLPPPPPHPASSPAIAATCASLRLVIVTSAWMKRRSFALSPSAVKGRRGATRLSAYPLIHLACRSGPSRRDRGWRRRARAGHSEPALRRAARRARA